MAVDGELIERIGIKLQMQFWNVLFIAKQQLKEKRQNFCSSV